MMRAFKSGIAVLLALASSAAPAFSQQTGKLTSVPPKEGDYVIKDFKFADAESLPEIKMHYTTIGTPHRDANGRVTNAVVVLHGTNRKGGVFLVPSFAGVLFGPGQLLDTSKYYVILPDQLGAGLGKSTKPSDGLRAKFPHYDYADMLSAAQMLLKDGLQVDHVRLFIGASMGCMEGFMWSEEPARRRRRLHAAFLPSGPGRRTQPHGPQNHDRRRSHGSRLEQRQLHAATLWTARRARTSCSW